MKHIYVNLKRFDIPPAFGGVNRLAPSDAWAKTIITGVQEPLRKYNDVDFTFFFPEAHILSAISSLQDETVLTIGSQGVYREDTCIGGNFGAFTSLRTANAMHALGAKATIIGHCEERKEKQNLLEHAGVTSHQVVNTVLNEEIQCAQASGLNVLYCIGESSEERDHWKDVLLEQITLGLKGADVENIVLAYEPIWAIGPGKTPPTKEEIQTVAQYIKEVTKGMDVVYGGGLKEDNAGMLAEIPEIDGGLIALTRFQGDIGFYPEEYLRIVEAYLGL